MFRSKAIALALLGVVSGQDRFLARRQLQDVVAKCYIAQCGCPGSFLENWCNEENAQNQGCLFNGDLCEADCNGKWCAAATEPTAPPAEPLTPAPTPGTAPTPIPVPTLAPLPAPTQRPAPTRAPTNAPIPVPTPLTLTPSPDVVARCYIAQCGCPGSFLENWCNEENAQNQGCLFNGDSCEADCNGKWCAAATEPTAPPAEPLTPAPTPGTAPTPIPLPTLAPLPAPTTTDNSPLTQPSPVPTQAPTASLPAVDGSWVNGTWTTGYWDCCKPSCAWPNKGTMTAPVRSCTASGAIADPGATSVCEGGTAASCTDNQPFVLNDGLSMGFVAVSVSGLHGLSGDANCGQCYELRFVGAIHPDGNWGGAHPNLVGKAMVVQVTNIGYDVIGEHSFDLQIPGAGQGAFNDGCPRQFPGYSSGHFDCDNNWGGCDDEDGCSRLPAELQAGCRWRYTWYYWLVSSGKTSNPYVSFRRVKCPAQLTEISGAVADDDGSHPEINPSDYA